MPRSDLIPRALRAFMPSARRAVVQANTKDLAGELERKAAFSAYYAALHAAGLPARRSGSWSWERAIAEGYERSLWTYKSVDTIAGHVSANPFQILQGEKAVDHPLVRLLNGRANPMETGPQLRERLSAQISLSHRGAFVEVGLSNGGTPKRLDLLPPGRTRPVPGDGDVLISHYEVLRADGTKEEIEPERIRWFRKVHPGDPYRGMTPLEAAGYSIELDFFARIYNLQFMRNDGRPAGVIAVNGEMSPTEMDRIEDRFRGGPMSAGELAVITGELSFVDLGKTPRDMAYQVTAQTAKEEVLTAFGVAESLFGLSKGSTFDNAGQDHFNFWTITMPPHLGIIATGFDDDSDDDLVGGFDLSKVEALQRAKTEKIEQARKDFDAGLISVDEYREIKGMDRIGSPETRCLYMPSGKTRIATSEADRKKLQEQDKPPEPPPALEPPILPGELEPGKPQLALPPGKQPDDDQGPAGRVPGGKPPVLPGRVHQAGAQKALPAGRPVLRVIQLKQSRLGALAYPDVRESAPDEETILRLEQQIDAAIQGLAVRWVERTVARLQSPKRRAGTRHWEAAGPADTRAGDTPIDVDSAVDAGTWQSEAQAVLEPILTAAAHAAALDLIEALTGPPGQDLKAISGRSIASTVGRVVSLIGAGAAQRATALAALIKAKDREGAPMADIVAAVRQYVLRLSSWSRGVSVQAATGLVNGARDAGAAQISGGTITRMWLSRRDAIVRPTHQAADRQARDLNEPFEVGEVLLDFPGDPDGPPEEVLNCRCRLLHRHSASGRFVAAPVVLKDAVGGQHVPGTPYEWRHGWDPRTPEVAERWKKPWRGDGGGNGNGGDAPAAVSPAHAEPVHKPDPIAGVDLERLSDPQIVDLYNRHIDEPHVTDRLIFEMDRRDQEEQQAREAWGHYEPDHGRSEEDRRLADLVGNGWDYKEAYAEVYNMSVEDLDRQERRAEAESARLPGESIDDTVRRMYDEWIHTQWLQAENATNGYLTRRGSDVNPVSLFSGPAHVARAHASEELLRWWEEHPRQTYTEFKADILARQSDIDAARVTQENRNGREFGV